MQIELELDTENLVLAYRLACALQYLELETFDTQSLRGLPLAVRVPR
jgi:hypothetical protein